MRFVLVCLAMLVHVYTHTWQPVSFKTIYTLQRAAARARSSVEVATPEHTLPVTFRIWRFRRIWRSRRVQEDLEVQEDLGVKGHGLGRH